MLLAVLASLLSSRSPREQLVGRAYAVDGDTLKAAGVSVRLQGVAAPELAHPGLGITEERGGQAAASFVRRLAAAAPGTD